MENIEILKDEINGNYIKDTNPYLRYSDKEIKNDVIKLYLQFNHLKNLYRQGWLKVRLGLEHKDKCESVADHSWSMALLAMTIIEKYKLNYDINKCIKMAIVHELGEIYTGDYTPDDHMDPDKKHEEERQNIRKLLSVVNFDNDFLEIWEEFESQSTEESIFMKELDKLEFLMQGTAHELDVEYLKYSRSKITLPVLKEILDELMILTKGKKVPKNVLEGKTDI